MPPERNRFVYSSSVTVFINWSTRMDLVTRTNQVGSTPLIVACGRDHFEVTQVLLEHGADILMKDKASE